MAKKNSARSSVKIKKKKWFTILAPASFKNVPLGESYVHGSADLKDKYVVANAMILTKNVRKQNINLKFKVIKVVDGVGNTRVVSYAMLPSTIRRVVRKGRDKVADSFLMRTKDNEVVRVKPLLITSHNASNAINTKIRLKARELITEYVSKTSFADAVDSLLSNKFQNELKNKLNSVYPMRLCDIRVFELVESYGLNYVEKSQDEDVVLESEEDTEEPVTEKSEEPVALEE